MRKSFLRLEKEDVRKKEGFALPPQGTCEDGRNEVRLRVQEEVK